MSIGGGGSRADSERGRQASGYRRNCQIKSQLLHLPRDVMQKVRTYIFTERLTFRSAQLGDNVTQMSLRAPHAQLI